MALTRPEAIELSKRLKARKAPLWKIRVALRNRGFEASNMEIRAMIEGPMPEVIQVAIEDKADIIGMIKETAASPFFERDEAIEIIEHLVMHYRGASAGH